MSVYVDPLCNHGWVLRGKPTQSCHLFADSVDELKKFAVAKLVVPLSWMQVADAPGKIDHFDLTPYMRKKAVKAGAVELSRKEAVKVWRQKHDA